MALVRVDGACQRARSVGPVRSGSLVGVDAVAVASRIKDMIEAPTASELVAGYFDAASSFGGDTVDSIGTNDPFTIRAMTFWP